MQSEDSIEQLKADLQSEQPDAVQAAVDAKAEEFLMACVKLAKTMQLGDDPWQGIRCLTEALIWIKESQDRLGKEIAAQRKPRQTIEAFKQ